MLKNSNQGRAMKTTSKHPLIGKIYDSVRDEDEDRVYEMWHASDIASCPRAQYFHRLGIKPTNDVGMGKVLRWRIGHLVEEEIRTHLSKIYKGIKSNQRLTSDKLELTGEYDNYHEGTLFEVKSVHPWAIKHLINDNKPYPSHSYQNHAYALLLNEQDEPVGSIVYIYVGLDGQLFVVEEDIDPNIMGAVQRRLDSLNKAWKNKKLPDCLCEEKTHPLYNSAMKWCDYKTTNSCCDPILINQLEEE